MKSQSFVKCIKMYTKQERAASYWCVMKKPKILMKSCHGEHSPRRENRGAAQLAGAGEQVAG